MKEAGSNLGIVYHVDVTFFNGKERRNTYYNADNAKEAVRFYKNKYSASVRRALLWFSGQSPAMRSSSKTTSKSPVSKSFGRIRFRKPVALVL